MSDVEIQLLSRMTELDQIKRVFDNGIRPEVFEDPMNQVVFIFMMDYWLNSQMQAAPTFQVVETEYPLVTLDREVDVETQWCCDWLRKRFVRNKVQFIAREAAKAMDRDPYEALGLMWREAYEATEIVRPATTFSDMATNKEERRQRYTRDRENALAMGMGFGLEELDEHTRGIRPGELAAIAAYTKVGKSWMLAKAYCEALRRGARPVMFTLEMDRKEMEDRIDCMYSGVSFNKFMRRELSFDEMAQLTNAQDLLERTAVAPLVRPQRGDRTVKTMFTQARQLGADFVLIDQLSWVDAEKSYTGDSALRMKHGELAYDIKEETSRSSVGELPTFLAIQLNRAVMNNDGRGALNNFANSSMIEQTVDIALGLWQNQDMRNSNMMGLDIMGSRRGDRKSWLLNWHLTERTEIRVLEEYTEAPS
ncbi:DnaB-like helicase [Mycobacterium phage Pleione]|uniref:DnaB-like dsDNA helicase n=3 Tax=Bixzunavirus TaxID=680114 RepID=G3M530_9CAUD|nr:DnaB [Mycobacterium phage Dandelion]YP_009017947.1 DnaB-like helicase [Mycobacterium phage Pleione]YP_009204729.1 DnaB helicase [Mycobacterium phage HyRo]UEM46224.1 DnaB-like dsDNA helicase [Mycobacterium phage Pinkcreek]AEL97847.1 DnaB-like dsDNA helicase [Mycobacterium phage Dandelion]AEN79793.1 DnaB-like dsDNA helicase [Mycobacterium phage Pleione]ALA48358.1 DnaB-like dsDNA helicase [Mycobacterium phage HyRo]